MKSNLPTRRVKHPIASIRSDLLRYSWSERSLPSGVISAVHLPTAQRFGEKVKAKRPVGQCEPRSIGFFSRVRTLDGFFDRKLGQEKLHHCPSRVWKWCFASFQLPKFVFPTLLNAVTSGHSTLGEAYESHIGRCLGNCSHWRLIVLPWSGLFVDG